MSTIKEKTPSRRIIRALQIANKEEFDLILREGPFRTKKEIAEKLNKLEGTMRKFFYDNKDALDLLLDMNKYQIKVSDLGQYIHEFLLNYDKINFIKTRSDILDQLYNDAMVPRIGIHKEIYKKEYLNYLPSLRRQGITSWVSRKEIVNLITSGKGILDIFAIDGRKLIDDLHGMINLISYYEMKKTEFIPITSNREYWYKKLHGLSFDKIAKISNIFSEVDKKLKNQNEITEKYFTDLDMKFLLRVCNLPLMDLSPNAELKVEVWDIVQSMKSGKIPDIVTIGIRAWIYNDYLQENLVPLGIIRSDALKAISKDGRVSNGAKILEEETASEWQKIQSDIFTTYQKEAISIGKTLKYNDIFKEIENKNIDFAVVPIPGRFFRRILWL